MGDTLIRNIPEGLRREIAEAADARQQSLSARAIDLLRIGMMVEQEAVQAAGGSTWTSIRGLFEAEGAPVGEYAEVLDQLEAERKRDFGRPIGWGAPDLTADDRS